MEIPDINDRVDEDNVASVSNSSPFSFWGSLGRPKFILAPMVDQSDLAFRLLTRRYGTELCYTPMLHSRSVKFLWTCYLFLSQTWIRRIPVVLFRLFVERPSYRVRNFQTCPEDSPIIAQFCGDDYSCILKATQMIASIAPNVNAIDINFGCPQVSLSQIPGKIFNSIEHKFLDHCFLCFIGHCEKGSLWIIPSQWTWSCRVITDYECT